MRLHVEDHGAGDPVVLAHAGVTDRRVWDLTMPALLGAGYRVIRYDAPGYGLSPMPTEPYSLVRLAIQVLDETGVESAHWVGLSMGGATGADLAIAAPGRVRSLSLVAPGLSGYQWPPSPQIDDVIGILRRWGADVL